MEQSLFKPFPCNQLATKAQSFPRKSSNTASAMIARHAKDFTWNRGCSSNPPPLKHGDQIPHPMEDSDNQIPSSPGRQRCQMPRVCPGGDVQASMWLIHKQNSFIWFWKNFTCSPLHPPKCSHACEKFRILAIASIMHVKFEVHMHDKVVSHVWKHFTCNKKFTHITNNFHMYYKISHVCQNVYMHVKCWCGELVFLPTLISHGYFFSHTFYTLFTLFSHT